MPRNYRTKIGARTYAEYSSDQLEKALNDVCDDKLTMLAAAKKYGISYGTIYNRMTGKHGMKKTGGQTSLTEVQESCILEVIVTCADWGCPLSAFDIRMITHSYLAAHGLKVQKFKDGTMPGEDWALSFQKRHKRAIGARMSQNIKTSRATVCEESVQSYFDRLKPIVEGIPAENIFNFDETALVDDPGRRRLFFRRGVKYPVDIRNFSKSQQTVMFCGSASGVLLPPYVIYKGDHLWTTWTENGPRRRPCCEERCCANGSRYNRSKSGWIDTQIFTDWFQFCFLPHAKRLNGKKVLIGDNLPAHFSDTVLKLCSEHDIEFCLLPPNTSHFTQPLDVSFFRSFKEAWRSVLRAYKERNITTSGIAKEAFPSLLNQGLLKMDSAEHFIKQNLISGFEACGIRPFDSVSVMKKVKSPNQQTEDRNEVQSQVNGAVVDYLRTERFSAAPRRHRKRTRLEVPSNQSAVDHNISESDDEDPDDPPPINVPPINAPPINVPSSNVPSSNATFSNVPSSNVTSSDVPCSTKSFTSQTTTPSLKQRGRPKKIAIDTNVCTPSNNEAAALKKGDFVLVKYNEALYPGEILSVRNKKAVIKCMALGKKFWKWPEPHDILQYDFRDIVKKISPPQKINKRGCYCVPEALNVN